MKQNPQNKAIVERMKPGVFSAEGFLGRDPRPWEEIVETDRSTLESLSVTCEQLVEKLKAVLNKAMATYGTPAVVGSGLTAVYEEAMGRIPCPFGDGIHAKGEIVVYKDREPILRFTPLSVHMISEHGFFQGQGSRYRIEPETVCRLLGLIPS
jgi:hypothetical protein